MSDNWNFYMLLVDNEPASIFVDLGIAKDPPKVAFPNMVYLRLYMRLARSDGLSSQDEFDRLAALEDALTPVAQVDGNAVFVGRNTCGGTRDFFFYARDIATLTRAIKRTMLAFPDYKYEIGDRADPDWDVYFEFLFPSPKQMQVMGNRDVCENLKRHGDSLQQTRRIDHWTYFSDEAGMNRFAMKIAAKGFEITDRGSDDEIQDEQKFRVVFGRDDKPCEIDDVVIPLFELAAEFGGRYDGWETRVIKDTIPDPA